MDFRPIHPFLENAIESRRLTFVLGALPGSTLPVKRHIGLDLTRERGKDNKTLWRACWEDAGLQGVGCSLEEAVQALSSQIAAAYEEKSNPLLINQHIGE